MSLPCTTTWSFSPPQQGARRPDFNLYRDDFTGFKLHFSLVLMDRLVRCRCQLIEPRWETRSQPRATGPSLMVAIELERDSVSGAVDLLHGHKQIHVVAFGRLDPKLELHVTRELGFPVERVFELRILSFVGYVVGTVASLNFFFEGRFADPPAGPAQKKFRILSTREGPFVFAPEIPDEKPLSDLQRDSRPVPHFAIDAFQELIEKLSRLSQFR